MDIPHSAPVRRQLGAPLQVRSGASEVNESGGGDDTLVVQAMSSFMPTVASPLDVDVVVDINVIQFLIEFLEGSWFTDVALCTIDEHRDIFDHASTFVPDDFTIHFVPSYIDVVGEKQKLSPFRIQKVHQLVYNSRARGV